MKIRDLKPRIIYGILCTVLAFIEVLISLFVHDSLIRPYFGDILIVILLCCLVRFVFPRGTQFLALYIFLFSAVIEIGQYFDYAALLGLDHIRFFQILLGSTFSAADLFCYAVGCSLFFACENLAMRYFGK